MSALALTESYAPGQSMRALLCDLSSLREGEVTLEQADGYLWRLEVLHRELVAMDAFGLLETSGPGAEVLRCVGEAHRRMAEVVEELQLTSGLDEEHHDQPYVTLSGAVGRPRFEIPRAQLEFLLQAGFSVPQIAHLICVSISTVRRRMTRYALSVRSMYSSLTDDQLDSLVSEIQGQFPNAGNRQMYGLLSSRGVRVQFHRIRESQSRVDPEGSFMRRLHCLYRRRYSVAGPQHLWHIDGNHKLIRCDNTPYPIAV